MWARRKWGHEFQVGWVCCGGRKLQRFSRLSWRTVGVHKHAHPYKNLSNSFILHRHFKHHHRKEELHPPRLYVDISLKKATVRSEEGEAEEEGGRRKEEMVVVVVGTDTSATAAGESSFRRRSLKATCRRLRGYLRQQKGRLYIIRRCVVMLLCWHDWALIIYVCEERKIEKKKYS